ncbi:MAG TPA: MmgE/PrpD family protein [Solirubrobacteraceae bacterium]|jgi:2-methylcitrate dehydratase|nr:MmgE/PrpD family protein [Solirubrobacteraceae bacterium]
MDQVLKTLSEVVETGRGSQPPEAVHAAKRMLLDSVGCALGSYAERVPVIIREVVGRRPAVAGSPVFGSAQRVQPDAAAFANSVMIRFLDYNDTYVSTAGVGHPSDYIPAALVQLGNEPISGSTALRSILVGYEVFCRLTGATRLGVEGLDHVINGAVASAAAACVANGLSEEQTREAMSLAITANLALQATRLGTLSMWKGCAAGNACRNGVFAAELAAAGLTGPEAPFEGRGGLFGVTGQAVDWSALRSESGAPAILSCHVKRFPSGYFSQGAIEAALEVRAAINGRTPAAVQVGTFEFGKRVMAGDPEKWRPTTRETADHSIPYVVACALARGEVTHHDLDESQLGAPEIRALLDMLTVEVDPECMAAWPEACMNRVTVRFGDGSAETRDVRCYRGHADNPVSDAQLEEKLRRQAGSLIPAAQLDELVAAIWSLDEAASPDGVFDWRVAEERLEEVGAG